MNNMSKIAFLFNSRNNYMLFDQMFFRWSKCNFDNHYMFNVDIVSSEEQKKIGEVICKNHNMINLNMDDDKNVVAVARTLEYTFDYIEKNNLDIDWVMWWCTDNTISDKDFLVKLENFIYNNEENINEKVGIIGFAAENYEVQGITHYGRTLLIDGGFESPYNVAYQHLSEDYLNSSYFVVETSMAVTSGLINRKLYRKYIKSDYNFPLYMWADDLSMQFNMNNIATITVPNLSFADGNRTKEMFGVNRAYDSLLKGQNYYHLDNNLDHHKFWEKKWKFDAYRRNSRDQIRREMKKYEGTLVEKIFNNHIKDGPKKLKDFGL